MKKTQTIFDISQNNKVYTTKRQKTILLSIPTMIYVNEIKQKIRKALIFILPSSFLLYSCLFIEAWCIKRLKGHNNTPPVCHHLDQSLIKNDVCLSRDMSSSPGTWS